jgi:AraC-like DNA-binding protein
LGQNLNLQGKYDESLKSLNEALVLAEKYQEIKNDSLISLDLSIIYSAIGETLYNQKKWDEAEKAFVKVIEYSKSEEDPKFERAYSSSFLGKIYFHRKEYQRAVDTLLVAAKSNDNKRSYIQADLYYSLSQAYTKLDNEKLSHQYNTLYLAEKEKISDEEKMALSESLKNELRIAKEQEEKKRFNLVLFVSIIAVIIGLGTFVVIRLLKKKKAEKLLFEKAIAKLQESILEKEKTSQEIASQSLKTKKTTSSATEDTETKLLQRLEKFEKSEAFLNPKVSLSTMASQFNTNQSYISELINTARNKSFNQYINDLRIDFICQKIYEDSVYQNYKISHLAELCGYPSHTAFTKIFKKVTGISPSVFIANAKLTKQV